MMFRNLFTLVVLICLSTTLFSCASTRADKVYAFDRILKDYNNFLQAKDVDEAAALVGPAFKEQFFKKAQEIVENTNISSITIRKVETSEDGEEATVTIIREMFDNKSYVVKKVTITQKWKKFGSGDGSWRLIDGDV